MNTVLALLPSSHAAYSNIRCLRLSSDAQLIDEEWSADTLSMRKGEQCVVMVPGACLSWLAAQVPAALRKRHRAQLLPLLQGMVEEQALDDVDTLHLALPPGDGAGEDVVLAACRKEWLEQWLQKLEHAGVRVLRVVPEFAPDILGDALWCFGSAHDSWVAGLRQGRPLVLPLESAAAVWEGGHPVNALPAVYAQATEYFGAERVQLLPERECLQAQLKTQWNLAQHGFAGTWLERGKRKLAVYRQAFFYEPQWRAARAACVVLALGSAVLLNVQAWRQQQAVKAQQAAIAQTVQQTFPQIRLIVDAPLQMQRELARLRTAAGVLTAADFEPMASAVGAALQVLGWYATSVQYSNGQMVLEGLPVAKLSALNERLALNGYAAQAEGNFIRVRGGR